MCFGNIHQEKSTFLFKEYLYSMIFEATHSCYGKLIIFSFRCRNFRLPLQSRQFWGGGERESERNWDREKKRKRYTFNTDK